MTAPDPFEIFLVCPPGLEHLLCAEAAEKGFQDPRVLPGGVAVRGGWPDVWRANLDLRGAVRVLARIGSFMAFHLAQLDKRARKFPWHQVLRSEVPVRVEVRCHASRIYHAGAAQQRIARALQECHGIRVQDDAACIIKARIDDNRVVLSVDTSGVALHKRGHKTAVGKAPLRETLAALFLRACGYDGREPVLDPMCGSGTFLIEAAEIAAGLAPGRARSFAFETLASFDAAAWQKLRDRPRQAVGEARFFGSDRDQGAVQMAAANAARAGVGDRISVNCLPIAALMPPQDIGLGLVMVNPPYGGRIGSKKLLYGLYAAFGEVMRSRFQGWRVGMVTSEPGLAKATGLDWVSQSPRLDHGGLKIALWRTAVLSRT
ncbi:MAG: class I SAM-dependent RNA methyltransferase [Pseudomonadota bacterium]